MGKEIANLANSYDLPRGKVKHVVHEYAGYSSSAALSKIPKNSKDSRIYNHCRCLVESQFWHQTKNQVQVETLLHRGS